MAQIYFLTHQHARAEKILSTPKAEPTFRSGKGKEPESNSAQPLVRLTDISIACRYLAAQCMVRQGKWTEALDLLGESNPFSTKQKQTNGAAEKPFHGGIKFEASMCHLRGLIHLHLNSSQKAKECFLEALTLDVKCYESFESLVDGNMLMVDEEWEFIQGLKYAEQTEEDAEFIRMAYTVRLKKVRTGTALLCNTAKACFVWTVQESRRISPVSKKADRRLWTVRRPRRALRSSRRTLYRLKMERLLCRHFVHSRFA